MRTHSPGIFRRSPANEFDTGNAANDHGLASANAGSLDAQARGVEAKRLHDEYMLGGYAGICTKQ
jgi:hypothetical protein